MAPLIHELRKKKYGFNVRICATGQHRDMLSQALEIFELKPDANLNVMRPAQDLSSLTASILSSVHHELVESPTDLVLVHGDTTTAMAGALAAFYQSVPVGHVEAGLRTHNILSPFPEELNRQQISRIATWHFAPTAQAKENLLAEGVIASQIWVTGNTVIDALMLALKKINESPNLSQRIRTNLDQKLGFDFTSVRFVLITGHRRENLGQGFSEISQAIEHLALASPDVHFVYPVHLNPLVRQQLRGTLDRLPNVHLIAPLEYAEFISLLSYCSIVLTDSGGIQEEAPSLGKPVLVMRESTERPEAVEAGTARLVGAVAETITQSTLELLHNPDSFNSHVVGKNPFGDGTASVQIAEALKTSN